MSLRKFSVAAGLIGTLCATYANDLIVEIKMPPAEKKHHLYSGVQDITIKGNSFYRDGKPYFVSGAWQLDVEAAPWRHRLFSVDVCVYNPEFIFTCYGLKTGPDGVRRLELAPNPWYDAMLNRFLANKINFWHEHKAAEISYLTKDPNFKDASGAGHFVAFDPYHELGVPLYRELYKTWMRYTQNYPVWCYELFNEMSYDNKHEISRNAFRDAMREKYGTVDALNSAWEAGFRSFDDIDAPGFLADHGKSDAPRDKRYLEECAKYPALMVEWQKFQEDRATQAVETLMPIMRSYDPDPKVFSTMQSEMAWWMDHTGSGVGTKTMTVASDFLSHEIGTGLIESGNYRNYAYAAKMLRQNLVGDLVRGFCSDRPIFNAEAPLTVISRGVSEEELLLSDYAAMTENWRFFDATAGEPENWNAARLDASGWGEVRVPEMWGRSGYPECQVGLYRKEFKLSGEQLAGKVYLNGKGLADSGEIYVNGKPAGKVSGFNTPFTLDITALAAPENSVVIKIVNRYYYNNMYYGGIRGFIAVNGARLLPENAADFETRHFRTYYWSQMAHGAMNGIMLSYNPPQHSMAARSMPLIKRELENVADLVFLKENQPVPEAAMLYPYETMHTVLHKDYLQRLEGPATMNIMPYYTALVFRGSSPAVMLPEVLEKQSADGLKLIVAPNHLRFSPQSWKRLEAFVKAGGVLVTNYGSFTVNDETHGAFDPSALTGVEYGPALESADFKLKDGKSGKFEIRHNDQTFGRELVLKGARACRQYADGKTAVAVNDYGKGRVYVIGGNFPPQLLQELIGGIADEVGVRKFLEVKPHGGHFRPEYVDMKRFTGGDGSVLLYVLNYDVSGSGVLHTDGLKGRYRMRNVENAKPIVSPSGGELWSEAELAAGIPVRLNQFSPVVVLLEPENVRPREFKGISPTRLAMLNKLWVKPEEIPGAPVVGFTPLEVMNPTHGTFPTALQLVADHGFNVRNLPEDTDYEGLDVVMYAHQRLDCRNPDRLLEFVREGGGLLLTGSGALNYHMIPRNDKLLREFGIEPAHVPATLYNPDPKLPEEDCLNVRCRVIPTHPVNKDVGEFVSSCAGVLNRYPRNAAILLRAPADDPNYANRPVAVAFEYGKGRVIYIADYWFVRPLSIDRGDNAQFFLNAINFLAGKEPVRLTAEAKAKSLYINRELLEQAEREEAAGITTFEAPADLPSVLDRSDVRRTEGIKGGDPIVDAMKNF